MSVNFPNIQIKFATEYNVTQVVDLFKSFMSEIEAANPNLDLSPYVEAAIHEELTNLSDYYLLPHRNTFLIGLCENDVFGCIGCEEVSVNTAEMRRLIVSKKYRRRGWGAKLVSRLESECLKMGYSKIMLETSELQLAAIALYRSLGYKMLDPVVCDTAAHKGVSGIARYRLVKTIV